MQKMKTTEERNQLINQNLKLVPFFAKKFVGAGFDMEELISFGNEGLIQAAEHFDPEYGTQFSTYASYWIDRAITRSIAAESRTVYIPLNKSELVRKVEKTRKELTVALGHEATVREIAEALNLPEDEVQKILQTEVNTVSMDKQVGDDADTTLGEMLADENASNPYLQIEQASLHEDLMKALGHLSEKEVEILCLRFGLNGREPMNLSEIARLPEYNVSRERVRQIEAAALKKLQRIPSVRSLLEDYALSA